MTVTESVKKMGDTVVDQGKQALGETPKPLYALIGANSYAIEKTLELPVKAQESAKHLQGWLTELQDQATAIAEQVKHMPAQMRTLPRTLPKTIPAQAMELRDKAEETATDFTGRVLNGYGQLVVRGEDIVMSIRQQPSTKAAETQIKSARTRTKAAATSTKRAASATAKAANDAAHRVV